MENRKELENILELSNVKMHNSLDVIHILIISKEYDKAEEALSELHKNILMLQSEIKKVKK